MDSSRGSLGILPNEIILYAVEEGLDTLADVIRFSRTCWNLRELMADPANILRIMKIHGLRHVREQIAGLINPKFLSDHKVVFGGSFVLDAIYGDEFTDRTIDVFANFDDQYGHELVRDNFKFTYFMFCPRFYNSQRRLTEYTYQDRTIFAFHDIAAPASPAGFIVDHSDFGFCKCYVDGDRIEILAPQEILSKRAVFDIAAAEARGAQYKSEADIMQWIFLTSRGFDKPISTIPACRKIHTHFHRALSRNRELETSVVPYLINQYMRIKKYKERGWKIQILDTRSAARELTSDCAPCIPEPQPQQPLGVCWPTPPPE
jgi:hypothetical protein